MFTKGIMTSTIATPATKMDMYEKGGLKYYASKDGYTLSAMIAAEFPPLHCSTPKYICVNHLKPAPRTVNLFFPTNCWRPTN